MRGADTRQEGLFSYVSTASRDNLLFRWFVGLSMDEKVWVPTVFTHKRDRLLQAEIVHKLFAEVDGTLIEAWASMKSFHRKDDPPPPGPGRNGEVDFRGETRTNDSHESTTDPDCQLYRKAAGQSSKLCHMGHLPLENCNGFIVATAVTPPSGTGRRGGVCRRPVAWRDAGSGQGL